MGAAVRPVRFASLLRRACPAVAEVPGSWAASPSLFSQHGGLLRTSGACRGIKYNLFPRLDFLAYLKRIHVAYHPGREKTEVARRLIMRIMADTTKVKYPQLQASWELLGHDAPTTIDVEFVNGNKKRFLAEHYTQNEMQDIADAW